MRKTAIVLKHSDFSRHTAIYTGASMMVIAISYLFNMLSGRVLGPALYSEITTMAAYSLIFLVPATAINILIIRKVGAAVSQASRQSASQSIERWIFQEIKRYIPLLLAGYVALFFVAKLNNLSTLSAAFLPAFIFFLILGTTYGSLLQSLKLFSKLSLLIVLAALIKLAGPLLSFSVTGSQLTTIVVFMTASVMLQTLIGKKLFERSLDTDKKKSVKISAIRLPQIVQRKEVLIVLFSMLGIALLNNFDLLVAKKLLSPTDAGLYGVWSLFSKVIAFSLVPLASVAFVFFSDRKSQKARNSVLKKSLLLILGLGLLAFAAYHWLSGVLILFLMGNKYLAIVPYLSLSAVFGTVCGAILVVSNYFLAHDSSKALIVPALFPLLALVQFFAVGSFPQLIGITTAGSVLILIALGLGMISTRRGQKTTNEIFSGVQI